MAIELRLSIHQSVHYIFMVNSATILQSAVLKFVVLLSNTMLHQGTIIS